MRMEELIWLVNNLAIAVGSVKERWRALKKPDRQHLCLLCERDPSSDVHGTS